MRKFLHVITGMILLSFYQNVNAQVEILPIDDKQQAYAGEEFQYDVDHDELTGTTGATYSLVESLDGMTINATTGLIAYTPTTIFDGGKVIVRVDASKDGVDVSDTETFYIYVTDAVQCPEGSLSYWKLDEADGATSYEDYIGGNNLQVITSSPKDTAGVVDSAKVFQSETGLKTESVDLYNWNKSQSFSVEFWMKPSTDANNVEVFVGRNAGNAWTDLHWWVGRDADNQIIFAMRNSVDGTNYEAKTTAEPYYPGGTTGWHHVMAIRDAENALIKLYIDNTLKQETAIDTNNNVLTSTASLDVGYLNNLGTADYFYNGGLDEVIVYNKALTSTEIQERYNTGNNGDAACSPGNFAPLFISEPVMSVDEDVEYNYTVSVSDVESPTLTVEVPILPSWLTFDETTNVISGIPTNENVGDTTVKITVTDGELAEAVVQEYTLTVNNVNDAPAILSETVTSVDEDELFSYQLEYEDVDEGDVVTLSSTNVPDWLTFNPATGVLSGTPTNENVGTHEFSLIATDVDGATDELVFSLEVVNINDAPVITGQETLATDEDQAITVNVSDLMVTDVDNQFPEDFSITLMEGENYTFEGNVVTPELDYFGELTVPLTLSDGDSTENFDLAITVNPVNDAPVITSSPELTVDEEQEYTYVITYTDVDDEIIEILVETLPEWLTLDSELETVSGTPDDAEVGMHTVELWLYDGTDSVSDAFQITVEAVNDVPEITGVNPRGAVAPGAIVPIKMSDLVVEDPDNADSELSVVIESGLNYTLSGDTAVIPSETYDGALAIHIKVTDGEATTEVFDYIIEVDESLVGINKNIYSSNLISNMYPVPAKHKITFEFNNLQPENNAEIEIYSITGSLIESFKLNNNTKLEIDLREYNKGVYIFNFINGNEFQTGKFVKN